MEYFSFLVSDFFYFIDTILTMPLESFLASLIVMIRSLDSSVHILQVCAWVSICSCCPRNQSIFQIDVVSLIQGNACLPEVIKLSLIMLVYGVQLSFQCYRGTMRNAFESIYFSKYFLCLLLQIIFLTFVLNSIPETMSD